MRPRNLMHVKQISSILRKSRGDRWQLVLERYCDGDQKLQHRVLELAREQIIKDDEAVLKILLKQSGLRLQQPKYSRR